MNFFLKRQRESLPFALTFSILLIILCSLLQSVRDLQSYFLSAMLGTAASCCFAVSWGIYLYRDKLLQGDHAVDQEQQKRLPKEPSAEVNANVINDENDLLNLFHKGLIPRPPEPPGEDHEPKDWPLIMQDTFLWTALLLLGYTLLIYYLFGIGATYF